MLSKKPITLTAGAKFDVCGFEGNPDADRSPLCFLYWAALPKGGSRAFNLEVSGRFNKEEWNIFNKNTSL